MDPELELYAAFMAANEADAAIPDDEHPALRAAGQIMAALTHKRLATVQARAALAGITLYEIEGDFGRPSYVATIGAVTTHLDRLEEAEAWLDRVTGAQEPC